MADSFQLVDRALQGTLETRLQRMRAEGWSMRRMADALSSEGFAVSRETIRRWLKRLGLPTRTASRRASSPSAPPAPPGRSPRAGSRGIDRSDLLADR